MKKQDTIVNYTLQEKINFIDIAGDTLSGHK